MHLRCSNDPYRLSEPSAVGNRVFAERSFSYMAPRLYNKLPVKLKSIDSPDLFKSKLKTHFFQLAYNIETQEINPEYKL